MLEPIGSLSVDVTVKKGSAESEEKAERGEKEDEADGDWREILGENFWRGMQINVDKKEKRFYNRE